MFRIFLKIAFRHLWETRPFTIVNIIGLSVGTVCLLLAALFITDERNFDSFHSHNPNIYRISTHFHESGKVTVSGGTGQVQGPAFVAALPEIRQFTRVMGGDIYGDIQAGNSVFKLQQLFVDESFLDIFTFPVLEGNPSTALHDINAIVITETTALKIFNRINVVGEFLKMDADPSAMKIGRPLVVTAVLKDPPPNSSIQFDILLPFKFLQLSFSDTNWSNAYLGTFVLLRPSADVKYLAEKMTQIGENNSKQVAHNQVKAKITYNLQAMTDLHLNPQEIANESREAGIVNGSKPIYSYLFLTIAAFVMLMASINYINIMTALSVKRAKEIGIRKVTGSGRLQIIVQFLAESAILIVVSLLFSVAFLVYILPQFNEIVEKQIPPSAIFQPQLLAWISVIMFFNLLVSGLYPAYLVSNFNPAKIFQGTSRVSSGNWSAKNLVVLQFSIAISLVIGTLIIYQQMDYISSKNLGYQTDQIVKVRLSGARDTQNLKLLFSNKLHNNTLIEGISLAGEFSFRDVKANDRVIKSYYRTIDEAYLHMLKIKLKEGRNFSSLITSDKKSAVLVNEAFVKAAAIQNPLGQTLTADPRFGDSPFTIVGVTEDFHFSSLREKIQPMVMPLSDEFGGEILLVKLSDSRQEDAFNNLEKAFSAILPGTFFDYTFLKEENARQYQRDTGWRKMILSVTTIAVIICFLGLFTLVHLNMTQRRKEIAIRLVLGAKLGEIIGLFYQDFMKMIIPAVLISFPVTFYIMQRWLNDFAYRVSISAWLLALPGFAAILIVFFIVCILGKRAVSNDPASELRSS
jgi:putative ABC transport system permease protein